MTKKSRRRKRQVRLSATQLRQPGVAAGIDDGSIIVAQAMPDLREEYGYVITDLKRGGIIAAVALAVVIVLVLVLV